LKAINTIISPFSAPNVTLNTITTHWAGKELQKGLEAKIRKMRKQRGRSGTDMAWQVHVNDGYASLHFASRKGREDKIEYRLKEGTGADTSPFCMPSFP
jgi:hypothetical protein